MKYNRWLIATIALVIILGAGYYIVTRTDLGSEYSVGDVVDNLNKVEVYYNGGVNQSYGRNLSRDGYNIGIRYQCVEFVKRYYYQRFRHKMPDSFGHAKDFFDSNLEDGQLNHKRALIQFKNGGKTKPLPEDIIVFAPWLLNPYGHVAIISKVEAGKIEIVQQNPGPLGRSRETYGLSFIGNRWKIEHGRVLGWLRLTGK